MNDVPGHPMPIASMLASGGTKYLVTGANTFINNATDLAPGKVPFYWEAPDGNKVLLWISQGNRGAYVEAFTQYYLDPYSVDPYTDRKPFDMFNPEMAARSRHDDGDRRHRSSQQLQQGGYSHGDTHDFSNRERAHLWNSKHDEVKIKIANSPEF
jgi:hypothetical protein